MRNKIDFLQIIYAIIALVCINHVAYSQSHNLSLIQSTDLKQLGEESARSKRPILLLISREGCPYCILIKREILHPMLISGNYREKIIIREIVLNTTNTLYNFNGSVVQASELADELDIEITPTLLFLGSNGEELTERIVGINTIELFSYYVDQAIDKAVLKFQSR